MDCKTGEIFNQEETTSIIKEMDTLAERQAAFRERLEKYKTEEQMESLIPIDKGTYQQLKPLQRNERKNKMRNRKCICGSGKKFKKCCWSKYA